jgi:hypothetical protein
MTDPRKDAIMALRDAYIEAGSPRGPVCANQVCAMLATKRVFWPVPPGHDEPLYCDDCAKWAEKVLDTLGVKYRDEPLNRHTDEANASTHVREISLEG